MVAGPQGNYGPFHFNQGSSIAIEGARLGDPKCRRSNNAPKAREWSVPRHLRTTVEAQSSATREDAGTNGRVSSILTDHYRSLQKYLAVGPKKALDFETRVHYNAFVGEYGLRDSFFGNLNKMHKGLGG